MAVCQNRLARRIQRAIPHFLQRWSPFLTLKREQMLSFSNAMGEFDPSKSHCSRWKGLEPQHRSASLFDGSMVLFNHVVEVSAHTHLHLTPAMIFLTQCYQASEGCLIPVDVDLFRPWDSSMGDHSTEKGLCRLPIAISAEQRSDGLSTLVHRSK